MKNMQWISVSALALMVALTAGVQAQAAVAPYEAGPHDAAMGPPMTVRSATPVNTEGEGAGQSNSVNTTDDLFAGTEQFAKNATDVTEVTMDPKALGEVTGNHAAHAHEMLLSVVRSYTYDKPGMYNMADVEAYRKKLESGDWHCSVHIRELKTGESTDVCQKTRTDGLVESAVMTVEPKSLTFIHSITKKGHEDGSLLVFPGGAFNADVAVQLALTQAQVPMNLATVDPQMLADMAEMRQDIGNLNTPELRRNVEKMEKDLKNVRPMTDAEMQQLHDKVKQLQEVKPLQ